MSGFNFDVLSVIIGIVVGWIAFYIKHFIEMRKCKKEIEEYKGHLNRQMKITQEGNKALIDEIEKLKKENENLRITVKTLGQKPGRSELRLLNVYDSALRKMMLKAPGFSSAWEMALQEAEREYEENEKGLRTVIKKVFGPSISNKTQEEGENK
ncbi:MAG: hypothetical protein GXO31_08750 [Epsilonproteobacteria bacterium]|nr:hypothetical protein [Campylobacterota bacterium]